MAEAAMNPKQIQLKLEVYEKKGEKLGKITECSVNVEDISLQAILMSTFSSSWKDFNLSSVKCHSNLKGDYIDYNLKPTQVPYIQDSVRNNKIPTIIVFKENYETPPTSPDQLQVSQVPRTLSTVLRTMITEIPDPEKLPPIESEVFESVEDSLVGLSSNKASPKKRHYKPKKMLSVIESKDLDNLVCDDDDSPSSFISHQSTIYPHRPRLHQLENFQFQSMKSKKSQHQKSLTLTHQTSVTEFRSPKRDQNKRRSIVGGCPVSPTTGAPKDIDISGPIIEEKSHNWKKRSFSRTTRRGKNPKFSPTKKPVLPAGSFSQSEVHSVTVQPEEAPSFSVPCREFDTVGKLREEIMKRLRRRSCILTNPTSRSELCLTYKVDGIIYELFNDYQFIYNTTLYKVWHEDSQDTSESMLINASMTETNRELPTLYRFSKLTGVLLDEDVSLLEGVNALDFHRIAQNDTTAVKWARRTLHSYVDEVVHKRDAVAYSLSMELETGEIPMLLTLKIPIGEKVEITFHYKKAFSLVREVSVKQYASTTLREVFPCVLACGLVEDKIDNYTLQFSGEQSYLDGDHELLAFKDIRRCIVKNEAIHLSIATKPLLEDDETQSLNWLPIDPLSDLPPLHTDISKERQEKMTEELCAASMWDQKSEFSLQVTKVENLPIPLTKDAKKLHVVVEVSLYHADSKLVHTHRTKPLQLSSFGTLEWMEMAMFEMETRNLPKASKIMIVVKDYPRKETSVSSTKDKKKEIVNIQYWGLVPLFDHRGVLQSGLYTANLWKGPMPNSKVERYSTIPEFDLNPCAPCINNPDPQSVKVTIQFPRYTYPVFFPSSEPETCSFLLDKENKASIRKQFDHLLKCLSEGKLPMSAVPTYVHKTNWGMLSQVIEAYMLLEQVSESDQGLPVETAMKLLDCEFADEKVRSFAAEALDSLSDSELEDFLLQLTQALKFEPSHDSTLARFLLKRSLRNKRIGHFFFWYLKCELYNPMFIPRFAVLLEAYLKGCGKAMLQKYESQVNMQQQLEQIGRQVGEKGGNDNSKMQSLLKEYLHQNGMEKCELTPVYNPRIKLGQLQPAKCKIMVSKKKPQWLEMRNVDPTALGMAPTRLILKLGDDLRQDVIVLRMLSLFEKLWERDGLPDLHLIPYGCMATGPNTGFIEVVKNARTIADVSDINDQRKLYEWIRNHQKNDFGEEDPEMLKEAVKRFTYSLAGYTVATYVLGIGDRHNDNIMITSSGNLFHIDFGHFLGNTKRFWFVKREWSPFVLTPDFVYLMGGENSENFATYRNLCCRAFLCLRRHKELIFNLFSLMRSTGIPELVCVEDANYISDALMENKPDHEAEQHFKQLIKKCLDLQWTVQIMWWFHLKHTATSS